MNGIWSCGLNWHFCRGFLFETADITSNSSCCCAEFLYSMTCVLDTDKWNTASIRWHVCASRADEKQVHFSQLVDVVLCMWFLVFDICNCITNLSPNSSDWIILGHLEEMWGSWTGGQMFVVWFSPRSLTPHSAGRRETLWFLATVCHREFLMWCMLGFPSEGFGTCRNSVVFYSGFFVLLQSNV